MAKKRQADEIAKIFEKIKNNDGEWKTCSVLKIENICKEAWTERKHAGICEFGFEEFYLDGEPTQIVRCKRELCVERKPMDLRQKESWYYVQPVTRHLAKCRLQDPTMKISDRLSGKSFYKKTQMEKIKMQQALVCAQTGAPEGFWEHESLHDLYT